MQRSPEWSLWFGTSSQISLSSVVFLTSQVRSFIKLIALKTDILRQSVPSPYFPLQSLKVMYADENDNRPLVLSEYSFFKQTLGTPTANMAESSPV